MGRFPYAISQFVKQQVGSQILDSAKRTKIELHTKDKAHKRDLD